MEKIVPSVAVLALSLLLPLGEALAWSNGGFSDDPSDPDYGTHDWIAHHALDWLPAEEKAHIEANLNLYLYGTELPDNGQVPDGIGDTFQHHAYYFANESLQDDASASRAAVTFQETLQFLLDGNLTFAAKHAGILTHYVDDLCVFGHVMGSGTDWGTETHHSDYENYVNTRTSEYEDEFNTYLAFDGALENISPYDAALTLAFDTTFDADGELTATWMDLNYDWSDPAFRDRAGESLNLCVNLVADILHTLYVEAQEGGQVADYVVINEVELNPPGLDGDLGVEEWVELYNPTSESVDVGGWTLQTTSGVTVTVTIMEGSVIEPYGYLHVGRGAQWLDNTDESVVLLDADAIVDETPTLSDTATGGGDGRSWQRYPDGQDTDSAEDWIFEESTPEYENIPEFPLIPFLLAMAAALLVTALVFRRHLTRRLTRELA